MNLRKRTLALLLTLCMLLSVVVPMASAEGAIHLTFGKDGNTTATCIASKMRKENFTNDYDDYFRITFLTADAAADTGWCAVRISGSKVPTTGTYTFAMSVGSKTMTGMSYVYFLKDTAATDEALTEYITEGMKDSSTYCGLFDSSISTNQNMGSVTTDGKDFILVFKCHESMEGRSYPAVGNLYFTPVATQSNVASNGGTEFKTVAEAITAAVGNEEDKIVTLIADATANVEVPEGITLDLNGNTLTATEFECEGTLADSSDGNGLVKTTHGKPIKVAATDLLLYDNRAGMGGYRVYKNFEIAPHYNPAADAPEMETITPDVKRLWIRLYFTNKEAYEVIAAGNSGIEIGTALSWTPNEGASANPTLTFDGDIVKEWADIMADPSNTKEYGFCIQFTGFGSLAAGKLTLTPFVGNVSSGTSVSYDHAG